MYSQEVTEIMERAYTFHLVSPNGYILCNFSAVLKSVLNAVFNNQY